MQIGQRYNPNKMFHGVFIPNGLLCIQELSAAAKLVWGRLLQYAGEDGACYPKQETLAEEVGVATSTIKVALQSLVEMGLLSVERPTGKDKLMHKSNKYFFIWSGLFENEETALPIAGKRLPDEPENGLPIELDHKELDHKDLKEKDKKEKSVRTKNPTTNFLEMFPQNYQSNPNFVEAWLGFVEHRKQIKKVLTKWAVELNIRDIKKFKPNRITDITNHINKAVQLGWQGLYIAEMDKPRGGNTSKIYRNDTPTKYSEGEEY